MSLAREVSSIPLRTVICIPGADWVLLWVPTIRRCRDGMHRVSCWSWQHFTGWIDWKARPRFMGRSCYCKSMVTLASYGNPMNHPRDLS